MADSSPQGAPIDRYVVNEYLSEGGMGAIYVGKKLGAGGFAKQVVLKQLLPEFTSQPEFKDLFLREARLSATLDHANIVHTIDLVTAGEEYFIVMEYVPGADLRTLLKKAKRRRKHFSPSAGVYITREVLSALSFAHAKHGMDGKHLGLIHRDVSPSNVLVSHNGEVKLTDFGIAKASTHNSVFYRVKGKVGYMSPEQAKSQNLDHRSDLYSLAVCLYEIISGERLFLNVGLTTSADEMYSQPVPHLSRKVPGVPDELDRVLQKALHVDPDQRYQTAGAFQEALVRCAHRAGLMISAPELAAHLREVCGEPEGWRNLDEDGAREPAAAANGGEGGTEVYAREGTEVLDASEAGNDRSDLDFVSVGLEPDSFGPIVNERERREKRSRSSMFDLNRLRGIHLTSMIVALPDSGPAMPLTGGAAPLVDLDNLGRTAMQATLAEAQQGPDTALAAADPGFESTSVVISRDSAPSGPTAWQSVEPARGASYPTPRPFKLSYGSRDEHWLRKYAWLILALILLAGIGAAVVVGMSGPQIGDPDDHGGSAPLVDPSGRPGK